MNNNIDTSRLAACILSEFVFIPLNLGWGSDTAVTAVWGTRLVELSFYNRHTGYLNICLLKNDHFVEKLHFPEQCLSSVYLYLFAVVSAFTIAATIGSRQ